MERQFDAREALLLERSLRLFKYLFFKQPQPPFKLVLTPTDRCNMNCFFCPNYTARKQNRFKADDEIDDSVWLDVIKQSIKLGVRQWCFLGGGEPLLRRDLIAPAIKEIRDGYKSIDVEIITNGTLFTPEIIRALNDVCAYKLRDGHEHAAIQTTISIHGENRTYQTISGQDAYAKVMGNIRSISQLKKASGLKNPVIQVNVVVNKKNMSEVEALVAALSANGVDQIALHPIHVYDEIRDVVRDVEPSPDEYKGMISTADRMRAENKGLNLDYMSLSSYLQQMDGTYKDESDSKIRNQIESDDRYRKYSFLNHKCFEPWYDMLINPDGRVARCSSFFARDEPINVVDESLESIWSGEYLENVRRNITNGVHMVGCDPCALMSNTIILRGELKKFIDNDLQHNVDKLAEVEKFVKAWSTS